MVITRRDWRTNGDLLQWLGLEFPGLTRAEFEAGYELLSDPNLDDEAAWGVEELLRGCVAARKQVAQNLLERGEQA